MSTTLYLTADEKKAFDKLPESVRKGVKVEVEKLTFEDSDEKRAVRFRNMKLTDERLLKLQRETKVMQSPDAIKKAMESLDITTLPKKDLIELYFVLGPTALSHFVAVALEGLIKGDTDLGGLESFSAIRHGLLQAMNQK